MKPIRLNRNLALEAVTQVADNAGGFTESWAVLGQHWAQVTARGGRIRASGEAALSEVPTLIVIRGAPFGANSRPVPEQRFREGPRSWRILAVTELDSQGRYLRCDTIEEATA